MLFPLSDWPSNNTLTSALAFLRSRPSFRNISSIFSLIILACFSALSLASRCSAVSSSGGRIAAENGSDVDRRRWELPTTRKLSFIVNGGDSGGGGGGLEDSQDRTATQGFRKEGL